MIEPQLSRQIPSLDVLCLTHVAGGGGGTKGPGRRGKTESRGGRKAGHTRQDQRTGIGCHTYTYIYLHTFVYMSMYMCV